MAKVFPPIAPDGFWPNIIAALLFLLSPSVKRYVRDLEDFREAHRFD